MKSSMFRIMARRDGAGIRLITRHGNDFTSRFPIIVAAVAALPARSFLIDGEAIVTNGDGLAVFDLIRHKRHGGAAVLCAFDLIELDGEDLRRSSIEYRKRKLAKRALGRTKVVRFLGTRQCPSELNSSKTRVWEKAKPPVFTHGPTALLFVEPRRRTSCRGAADRGEHRQVTGALATRDLMRGAAL
jgi:ATP-dependent DNA ligase